MRMRGAPEWRDSERHAPMPPETIPPRLNYTVLTGSLVGEPRQARAPGGDAVLLLEIEFPVAHPEHPRLLWTLARCYVEAMPEIGGQGIEGLQSGTPVLVSGQLSERPELDHGRRVRRGVLVASLVKPGLPTTGGEG